MAEATVAKTNRQQLAHLLDKEAAKLAGVAEILEHVAEGSGVGDSLAVCKEVIDGVNERISLAAAELKVARNG